MGVSMNYKLSFCKFRQILLLSWPNIASNSSVSANLSKSFKNVALIQNIRNYSEGGGLVASATIKKRPFKKKKLDGLESAKGFVVSAISPAEEFDLENLSHDLAYDMNFKLSDLNKIFANSGNVIHIIPKECENGNMSESKDAFVFQEGSVVLWNFEESEKTDILHLLKRYEKQGFKQEIVQHENEIMTYIYSPDSSRAVLSRDRVILPTGKNDRLEKFAISNGMALSVHLGAYESVLDDYIHSMSGVTEDLKIGKICRITHEEVLRKMGQLFALRHAINLSSDLLDTPDFYWDHEELENLYQHTFNYFCIGKRTKVMNERINHCIELVELLSTQLSDKHHIRLEWMIIALIMVEVVFEFMHYIEKYWPAHE